jgi:holin-like protein
MLQPGSDDMLAAFTLILVCQIAGEALVRGAGLPLPGPVIGMLLLFLLMRLRLPLPPELNDAADERLLAQLTDRCAGR